MASAQKISARGYQNPKIPRREMNKSKPPCLEPEQLERGAFQCCRSSALLVCVSLISPPLLSLLSPVFGFLDNSSPFGGLPQFRNSAVDPGARPVVNPVDQPGDDGIDGIDEEGNQEKQGTFGRRANIAG